MEKEPPSDAHYLHRLDGDRGGGWACADRAQRLRRLSARLLPIPAPADQRSRHSSGASGRWSTLSFLEAREPGIALESDLSSARSKMELELTRFRW